MHPGTHANEPLTLSFPTNRQLTQSLLRADFNLTLTLPPDRLCPPVPVRWNYIRWIQDLLDTSSESYTDRYDASRHVVGLDIGVGASAIYPLLATATRAEWRMFGTDVDAHSFEWAGRNVEANGLRKRVRLVRVREEGPLIPLETLGVEGLDFVMTNPPFYSSGEDMRSSYISKAAPPSAVCTGAENEMICPGGDVGFVSRMVEESLVLGEKVQWYTAMLGKMASLQEVVRLLKEKGVRNWAVSSLQPGKRTKRWAVAWSFQGWRVRNDVGRHGELVLGVLPPPTAQTVVVSGVERKELGKRLDGVMEELEARWQWKAAAGIGVMEAKENVWSRAARRRRKMQTYADSTTSQGDDEDSEEEMAVALAVKMTVADETVEVRWLRGLEHVVFESFCGMLKHALVVSRT